MITPITVVPRLDNPGSFISDADVCLQQMKVFSEGTAVFAAEMEAAVAAVESGLAAAAWTSGTVYTLGALAFSPISGMLYRRLSAGTGGADPSINTTDWDPLTRVGYPVVVVSGTTHTVAARTFVVLSGASAITLTLPASPSASFEFGIKVANGRLDNVLNGSGNPIESQADSVYLDGDDASGVWRYFDSSIGYGRA